MFFHLYLEVDVLCAAIYSHLGGEFDSMPGRVTVIDDEMHSLVVT